MASVAFGKGWFSADVILFSPSLTASRTIQGSLVSLTVFRNNGTVSLVASVVQVPPAPPPLFFVEALARRYDL